MKVPLLILGFSVVTVEVHGQGQGQEQESLYIPLLTSGHIHLITHAGETIHTITPNSPTRVPTTYEIDHTNEEMHIIDKKKHQIWNVEEIVRWAPIVTSEQLVDGKQKGERRIVLADKGMKLLKPLLPQLAFLTYRLVVSNEHQSLVGETKEETSRETIRLNTALLVDPTFTVQPEDEVYLGEIEAVRDDLGNIFISKDGVRIFTKTFDHPVSKLFYRNGVTGKISQVSTTFKAPKLINPGHKPSRDLIEVFKPRTSHPGQDTISPTLRASDYSYWNVFVTCFLAIAILLAVVMLQDRKPIPPKQSIEVTDEILGHGSNGTVVYKGLYESRPVAVKRLLKDHYQVVAAEVDRLKESDWHPNIIRYYTQNQDDNFYFIALELCTCSLLDVYSPDIALPKVPDEMRRLMPSAIHICRQVAQAVEHLHLLKIVHRDIKPANVLLKLFGQHTFSTDQNAAPEGTKPLATIQTPEIIEPPQSNTEVKTEPATPLVNTPLTPRPPPGLTKRNEAAASTPTSNPASKIELRPFGSSGNLLARTDPALTILAPQTKRDSYSRPGSASGASSTTNLDWRNRTAIESPTATATVQILLSDFGVSRKIEDHDQNLPTVAGSTGWRAPDKTLSRSVDIFSLGCLFFYIMSSGLHPFGTVDVREYNIGLANPVGKYSVGTEEWDLVSSMIGNTKEQRLRIGNVLNHPYFWSAEKKLNFLVDVSEVLEVRDGGLENYAFEVFGSNWGARLDRLVLASLDGYRTYDMTLLKDLVRAIRNKKNHFVELRPETQRLMGGLPDGYLNYWTERFPNLILCLLRFVKNSPAARRVKGGFVDYL